MVLLASWGINGCKDDPEVVVPNYFLATPARLELSEGAVGMCALSGGRKPYRIIAQPKANVATAVLSGDSLRVTAVGYGSSSTKMGDASGQEISVTIEVQR